MGSSPPVGEASRRVPRKPQRVPFESRVIRIAILLVLPGFLISAILIWLEPWAIESKLVLLGAEALVCLLIGAALHEQITRPLQTLANVVGALSEEDYSFRARLAVPDDALGELSLEVNALADLLAQNRTGAIEAAALVQRVVEEVDVPIFAFDPAQKLRLVNSAGEKVLQHVSEQLLGRTASELRVESCLSCENETLVSLPFAGGARWFVRRGAFRQRGVPHTLVVLSDVSRALRGEERQAWQRLIRVIGHELNNSLAPIMSIAGSLAARLGEIELEPEKRRDFERGLEIIETRSASLNRFLQAYRQLAQMPPPLVKKVALLPIVERVAFLETRLPVTIAQDRDVTLMVDPDQVEQMLINLVRNAVEAVLELPPVNDILLSSEGCLQVATPTVTIIWTVEDQNVVLTIDDNGPGLLNPSNAFVPFYTTKHEESGIGLALSRQIAEAHHGSIEPCNGDT